MVDGRRCRRQADVFITPYGSPTATQTTWEKVSQLTGAVDWSRIGALGVRDDPLDSWAPMELGAPLHIVVVELQLFRSEREIFLFVLLEPY